MLRSGHRAALRAPAPQTTCAHMRRWHMPSSALASSLSTTPTQPTAPIHVINPACHADYPMPLPSPSWNWTSLEIQLTEPRTAPEAGSPTAAIAWEPRTADCLINALRAAGALPDPETHPSVVGLQVVPYEAVINVTADTQPPLPLDGSAGWMPRQQLAAAFAAVFGYEGGTGVPQVRRSRAGPC
jgi:hypothetical protein